MYEFDLATDADSRSKGYGWAKFKNHTSALNAMKRLQRSTFHEDILLVSLAEPRVIDRRLLEDVKSLFVKGLTSNVSEDTLRDLINQGNDLVDRVVIPLDKYKRTPLGHAFVHFHKKEEADASMKRLQGYELEGRKLSVEWCLPRTIEGTKIKTKKSRALHSHKPGPLSPYYGIRERVLTSAPVGPTYAPHHHDAYYTPRYHSDHYFSPYPHPYCISDRRYEERQRPLPPPYHTPPSDYYGGQRYPPHPTDYYHPSDYYYHTRPSGGHSARSVSRTSPKPPKRTAKMRCMRTFKDRPGDTRYRPY